MAGGRPDFFASSLIGEDMSGWQILLCLFTLVYDIMNIKMRLETKVNLVLLVTYFHRWHILRFASITMHCVSCPNPSTISRPSVCRKPDRNEESEILERRFMIVWRRHREHDTVLNIKISLTDNMPIRRQTLTVRSAALNPHTWTMSKIPISPEKAEVVWSLPWIDAVNHSSL